MLFRSISTLSGYYYYCHSTFFKTYFKRILNNINETDEMNEMNNEQNELNETNNVEDVEDVEEAAVSLLLPRESVL